MNTAIQTAIEHQVAVPSPERAKRCPWLPRSQKIITNLLNRIDHGSLILEDPQKIRTTFGKQSIGPQVKLTVNHPHFFERILHGGSLALGESYMDGWWNVEGERLVDLFNLFFLNKLEYRVKGTIGHKLQMLFYRLISNPRYLEVAKRDIQTHYDLGNDFFKHMLDSSMTYSCGYQMLADDSLEAMQQQKYERICKKLGLKKGGHLIDIGCGWGGMLLYAAKKYPNISGVGITLSEEQYRFASERILKEGLSDRLKIYLCDYRKMSGQFDYIVSIGMFEHVGYSSYPIFFKKTQELLKKNGVALLHTIGLEEDPKIPPDAWTAKYIFPGSRLPRLEEITREIRCAGLLVGHMENLRPHYARTLRLWNEKFKDQWPEIKKLGEKFNDRFYRMWDYYLQISEACFIDSTMELYQVLFCKQGRWQFQPRFEF